MESLLSIIQLTNKNISFKATYIFIINRNMNSPNEPISIMVLHPNYN